jgi:hypothetical protein
MFNWFDLMRQAQGGAGVDNMARYFGLTPEQTAASIAALLPAFTMGLQHNVANPSATAQLFQLMTGGPYRSFWESAAQAYTPQARQEGIRLLDQLFGSDEVCRRVAQQAAAFSGVGVDILQQMLPLLVGILAGGWYKFASNQAGMFATLSRTPLVPSPAPAAETGAGLGPWTDRWTSGMTGVQPSSEADQRPAPIEKAVSAPKPRPPKSKKPSATNPFEAWGEMMEKGQEMQLQHLESLQKIFDGVWVRPPRKT